MLGVVVALMSIGALEITIYPSGGAIVQGEKVVKVEEDNWGVLFPSFSGDFDTLRVDSDKPFYTALFPSGTSELDFLKKFKGKPVVVETYGGSIKGTFLKFSGERIWVRDDDDYLTMIKWGDFSALHFEDAGKTVIPDTGKYSAVKLFSSIRGNLKVRFFYLDRNYSWFGEHTAVLLDGGKADLTANAVVVNSGSISGDFSHVNIAVGKIVIPSPSGEFFTYAEEEERGFATKAAAPRPRGKTVGEPSKFEEMWVYPVNLRVFVPAKGKIKLPIVKEKFDYRQIYKFSFWVSYTSEDVSAQNTIEITNSSKNPIPSGKIWFYKRKNGKENLVFVSYNDMVSPGDVLKVYVGDSSDIKADHIVVSSKTTKSLLGTKTTVMSVNIPVKNFSDKTKEVVIEERFFGDEWKFIKSSVEPAEKRASSATFKIKIPPHGIKEVSFTVKMIER